MRVTFASLDGTVAAPSTEDPDVVRDAALNATGRLGAFVTDRGLVIYDRRGWWSTNDQRETGTMLELDAILSMIANVYRHRQLKGDDDGTLSIRLPRLSSSSSMYEEGKFQNAIRDALSPIAREFRMEFV